MEVKKEVLSITKLNSSANLLITLSAINKKSIPVKNNVHYPIKNKNYIRSILSCLLFSMSLLVHDVSSVQSLQSVKGEPNECQNVLLVSSWFDNSIQVYDGCDQTFLGMLDTNGLVKGPQSIVLTPKGDLLIVSEGTNQLVLFKRQSGSKQDSELPRFSKPIFSKPVLSKPIAVMDHADGSFLDKPVGATFDNQGNLYVASYSQNTIVKINPDTWQITDLVLSPTTTSAKIKGVDAGFVIDGQRILIPGYDSDNVIQLDINTKASSDVLHTNQYGLDAARSVFVYGDDLLISAERSNKIIRINKHTFKQQADFAEIIRPASIVADGPQHILVTTRRGLVRFDLTTGEHQQLISQATGHIKGGTFAVRIDASLVKPLIISQLPMVDSGTDLE